MGMNSRITGISPFAWEYVSAVHVYFATSETYEVTVAFVLARLALVVTAYGDQVTLRLDS
jgi:hypothetical protein